MMEFILEVFFEVVFELVLEGSRAVGTNKKNSPWIRYPMLILAGISYFGIIVLGIFIGFSVLKYGLWRAIIIWALVLAYVVATIWALRKEYKKRKSKL